MATTFALVLATVLPVAAAENSDKAAPSDSLPQASSPFPPHLTWEYAEFRSMNYSDTGELLGRLSEASVRNLGLRGQLLSASLRGSPPSHVALILDGHPLVDPLRGFADLNTIAVDAVDRLTIRTAAPLLPFNWSAVGGAFLVDTQPLRADRPYSKVVYRSVTGGENHIGAMYGQRFTRSLDALAGVYSSSAGDPVTFDQYSGLQIRGEVHFTPRGIFSATYRLHFSRNHRDVPIVTPGFPYFGEPVQRERENRWDHTVITQVGENLQGLAFYSYLRRERESPGGTPIDLAHIAGGALQWNPRRGKFSTPTGMRFQLTRVEGYQAVAETPKELSAWLAGEIDAAPLSFRVMGTATWRTHLGTKLTPALEARLRPNGPLTIYANFALGHRAPSFDERFRATPLLRGNPDLNLEKAASAEGGILYGRRDGLYIQAALFHRRISNPIAIQADTTQAIFFLANSAERAWSGVDFHLHLPLTRALSMGGNASYVTMQKGSLADLQFQPQALGYGYIEGQHPFFNGELKAALRVSGRFIGERKGQFLETPRLAKPTISLGYVSLLDAKATFHYKDAIIGLSFDNILNTLFDYMAGYPAPGRRFRFEIAWEFLD